MYAVAEVFADNLVYILDNNQMATLEFKDTESMDYAEITSKGCFKAVLKNGSEIVFSATNNANQRCGRAFQSYLNEVSGVKDSETYKRLTGSNGTETQK